MLTSSFDRAVEHHRAGDLDKAITLYRHVLKTARGAEGSRVGQMLATALAQSGQLEQAEEALRAAVRAEPAPALRARRALSMMLAGRGRLSDAVGVWREAVAASAGMPPATLGEARLGLSIQLAESKRVDEALKEVSSLAREFPAASGVRYEHGRLLERIGRTDEARAELEEVVRLTGGMPEAQILLARIDSAKGLFGDAKERLERLMPGAPAEMRGVLLIELARVMDKRGEYATAFDLARNGQALNFGTLPQSARDVRTHEWVMAASLKVTAEAVAAWPRPAGGVGEPGAESPVFLVGFPRSGTTLVEQMLAAHPRVAVTDETPILQRVRERLFLRFRPRGEYPTDLGLFTADQVGQARRWYRELAENAVGTERLRGRVLVDKQPLNTVDLCFARLLFPEGRVVHVQRDPRDAVLSCFLQGFTRGVPHLFDLEMTARLFARFGEIWEHNKSVLGMKHREIRYEELVSAPEREARGLLKFLGLEWNGDVLASHDPKHRRYVSTPSYADVAEPVHTKAVGRWKRYEAQLEPVLGVLQPWVERLGYK
ncbi:MAG: tetratricopeptide repeat-containing sulfotransferase family protein [Phycisphaerales bacterium]